MEQPTRDLEPWEVPPDEAYWRALLREGEYGEGTAAAGSVSGVSRGANPHLPDAQPRSELPASGPSEGNVESVAARSVVSPLPTGDEESAEVASDPPDDPPAEELPPAKPSLAGEADCWKVFAQYQAEGQSVELSVEGYNRGGLLVRWKDVLGFVPASQLCDGLRYGDERSRLDDLSDRVGSSLTLRVIEVDGAKNRLILSERAARHIEDPDLSVLDTLRPGDVCRGQITNLCTFGAFVDLGGIEGLIHISEMSWGRVAHPSDMLQSGQEVEVYVLNVDREQGRIGLSLKRLQPDPWESVEERYEVNQVVEGMITNVVNFGAFVRLEEGLEGLIHTSELTGGMPPLHALREGEPVLVRINSIEGGRHRIGLSLERL